MKKVLMLIIVLCVSVGMQAQSKSIKKPVPPKKPVQTVVPEEAPIDSVAAIITPSIYVMPFLNYSIPSGDIASLLSAGIGVEAEIQLRNILSEQFVIGLAGSYNSYAGTVSTTDSLSVIQVKVLPKYCFKSLDNINLYVNGGIGFAFEGLTVSSVSFSNTDFLWQVGIGCELRTNGNASIIIGEINYIAIPQKSAVNATRDGSFININIGVSFNLTK